MRTRDSIRCPWTSTTWRPWCVAGLTARPSRRVQAMPAFTSSMRPARPSAALTMCRWLASSMVSGRTGRTGTSSTRRRSCASLAGPRNPSDLPVPAPRSRICCGCRQRTSWRRRFSSRQTRSSLRLPSSTRSSHPASNASRSRPSRGPFSTWLEERMSRRFLAAGDAPMAAGVALIVWAIVSHYDAAPEEAPLTVVPTYLARGGAYAVTRNPMYLGGAAMQAGWAILLGSLPVAVACAVYVTAMRAAGVPFEERLLRDHSGSRTTTTAGRSLGGYRADDVRVARAIRPTSGPALAMTTHRVTRHGTGPPQPRSRRRSTRRSWRQPPRHGVSTRCDGHVPPAPHRQRSPGPPRRRRPCRTRLWLRRAQRRPRPCRSRGRVATRRRPARRAHDRARTAPPRSRSTTSCRRRLSPCGRTRDRDALAVLADCRSTDERGDPVAMQAARIGDRRASLGSTGGASSS